MDDEGRLWVKRAVPADAPPFFDLFSDDGDYLGSIRLGFTPAPYRPLWVRHGSIYTVIEDELDVPYVVRGAVGDALKGSLSPRAPPGVSACEGALVPGCPDGLARPGSPHRNGGFRSPCRPGRVDRNPCRGSQKPIRAIESRLVENAWG